MRELCVLLLGAVPQLSQPGEGQRSPGDRLHSGCRDDMPLPPLLLHGILHQQVPFLAYTWQRSAVNMSAMVPVPGFMAQEIAVNFCLHDLHQHAAVWLPS